MQFSNLLKLGYGLSNKYSSVKHADDGRLEVLQRGRVSDALLIQDQINDKEGVFEGLVRGHGKVPLVRPFHALFQFHHRYSCVCDDVRKFFQRLFH